MTKPFNFSVNAQLDGRSWDSVPDFGPITAPLQLSGDLDDGAVITLLTNGTYSFGTKPNQEKTWFVWRADQGREPTAWGASQGWHGTSFGGEVSTEVLGPGSAASFRQSIVSTDGSSGSSFLGRIDFTGDSAYVFKRRYNDYEYREGSTFKIPVEAGSDVPEPGQLVTGVNGATGRFVKTYEQDGHFFLQFDPNDPDTTINKPDPDYLPFPVGSVATWDGGSAIVTGILSQQREHNNKNNRFWSSGNNNTYTATGQPGYNGATVTAEHTDFHNYTAAGRHTFIGGAWYDEQIVYKTSTLNNKDGEFYYYRDGVVGNPDLRICTRTDDLPNPYSQFRMDQFTRRTTIGEAWEYIDYVYFDNSHCRVLLANTGDLKLLDGDSLQTYKVIPLPILTWNNNTITAVYQNLLPDWTHMFIVDANNDVVASATRESLTERGEVSGGSAETILWTAPEGLHKGNVLTVSSTTPLQAPDKFVWVGFGEGWINTAGIGTDVVTHLAGTETVEHENISNPPARRKVTLDEYGNRYLKSTLIEFEPASGGGTGFLNWDTGRELEHGDVCWMFSNGRALFKRDEDKLKKVQLKGERIGPTKNLSGTNDNSVYIKQDMAGQEVQVLCYVGHENPQSFNLNHRGLETDGKETSFCWQWGINTPDAQDGFMSTLCAKDGYVSVTSPYRQSSPTNPVFVVKSDGEGFPRWVKVQDYIGNNDEGAVGIEIHRQDILWQLNGEAFILTDSESLSTSSEYHPLLPLRTGSESWDLKLWTKAPVQIEGMWIHRVGNNFVSSAAVQLTPDLG